MSIQLFIDDLIVPAHVQQGYLKGYDQEFLKTIEAVYQQVEAEALAAIKDRSASDQPEFILVAGSHGVGKSYLIQRLIEQRGAGYIVCDADAILAKLPGFEEDARNFGMSLQSSFDFSSMDMFRHRMEENTQRFRNAAKYINDRLMTKGVREGLPVIFETNAKTARIGDFMDQLKKAGVVFETHMCQAPLSIKKAGMEARFRTTHNVGVPAQQVEAEHDAMTKNMKTIAAKSTGNLTIYWRQDVKESLTPAVVATAATYTTDLVAYTGFNAYFMDSGMTVESLMGARQHLEAKPAPRATSQAKLQLA